MSRVLDSNVMISCQSFSCAPPPHTGACCFAGGEYEVEGQHGCLVNGGEHQGDGTSCLPNPCGVSSVPEQGRTRTATWGRIKDAYR